MIVIKRGDDMEYVEIDGHKLHLFRVGDEKNPKLVFMSGSGTISPVYDFKILYEKLVSDFRIIVIEKFGYGCSDLNCGHYIHYYESERISREIRAFVNQAIG